VRSGEWRDASGLPLQKGYEIAARTLQGHHHLFERACGPSPMPFDAALQLLGAVFHRSKKVWHGQARFVVAMTEITAVMLGTWRLMRAIRAPNSHGVMYPQVSGMVVGGAGGDALHHL